MALDLNAFSGSEPAGATTTSHDSDTFNVSPSEPYIQKDGVGTDEVSIASLAKYNIDIFGDMKSYNPKNTPFLTIFANMGGENPGAPMYTWADEYEGDLWVDAKIDDLRESIRDTAGTTYYAGRLAWEEVTQLPNSVANGGSAQDATLGGSVLRELALASGNLLTLGFDTGSDYIRGKKEEVIRKIVNVLDIMDYTETSGLGADTDTKEYYKYGYTSGTSKRVYVAFDDLAFKAGSTFYQKHEVVVGIDAFYFDTSYGELILVLDFDDSNIIEDLDSTATDNTILLEEVSTGNGTVFSSNYTSYYTRLSRLLMIGNSFDVPSAIPEGDTFSNNGNYIVGHDQYINFTQIFASDTYGITGTRQATKIRFKDDFQLSRARHLKLYKQGINAAMLFGVKSEDYDATTGLPKRTMSGILDYGLFPIRYMKKSIPDITSGTPSGNQIESWMNDIAYALNAYSQEGSGAHTLLTSRDVIRRIRNWFSYVGTTDGNILGMRFETIPPNDSLTLGLQVQQVVTDYGTLRFVEEPAFNYIPKFKASNNVATASAYGGPPTHLFPNGINPRSCILAVDKAHIKMQTLRGDKIEGNIQDNGRDMYMEAMRGEHGLKFRFPRNHAIIDVSS